MLLVELPCSPKTTSSECTPLMALVILTGKFPELNDVIKKYCKENIDQQNDRNWTALMMAARYSNTGSSLLNNIYSSLFIIN